MLFQALVYLFIESISCIDICFQTHFNPESSEIQKGLRIKLQSPKVSRSQPTASDVDASNAVSELSRIKLKKTTDWKVRKFPAIIFMSSLSSSPATLLFYNHEPLLILLINVCV